MEDLETVLPGGVQVTTLEPTRDKDGHITLHLRVLGPARPRDSDGGESGALAALPEPAHCGRERRKSTGGTESAMEPVSASNRVQLRSAGRLQSRQHRTNGRRAKATAIRSRMRRRAARLRPTRREHIGAPFTGVARPMRRRIRSSPATTCGRCRNERYDSSARAAAFSADLALGRAGCAGVVLSGLAVRFAMDWSATHGSATDAWHRPGRLKALELQTAPLRGLDKRVVQSRGADAGVLCQADSGELFADCEPDRRTGSEVGRAAVACAVCAGRARAAT